MKKSTLLVSLLLSLFFATCCHAVTGTPVALDAKLMLAQKQHKEPLVSYDLLRSLKKQHEREKTLMKMKLLAEQGNVAVAQAQDSQKVLKQESKKNKTKESAHHSKGKFVDTERLALNQTRHYKKTHHKMQKLMQKAKQQRPMRHKNDFERFPRNKVISLHINGGLLIPVHPRAKTLFMANPSVADFTVKAPGLMYLTAKQIGTTDLYGVSKEGKVLTKYKIEVTYDLGKLRRLINQYAPGNRVKVEQINNTIALRGFIKTAKQAADIRRLAGEFTGQGQSSNNSSGHFNNILNFMKVEQASQVYLRVRLLEVSRDVNNAFGITWNAVYGSSRFSARTSFPAVNGGGGGGTGAPGFNVDIVIEALANEGLVTILSEPNLTTLSGKSADFLAGGEFPIPVSQGGLGAVSVEFKRFGVSLAFTPTVIDKDTINLHVHPSVSELSANGAVSFGGASIPALIEREANTTVELRSGQSFAIAGLLQNNMSQVISKYPLLAEIPILGELFKSRDYRQRKTELVIVVTPYIVKPVSPGDIQYPRTAYGKFDSPLSYYQSQTDNIRDSSGFLLD